MKTLKDMDLKALNNKLRISTRNLDLFSKAQSLGMEVSTLLQQWRRLKMASLISLPLASCIFLTLIWQSEFKKGFLSILITILLLFTLEDQMDTLITTPMRTRKNKNDH